MAVTFDTVGPSSAGAGGSAVTSLSWSHTVGSVSAGTLFVGAEVDASPDTGVTTACTFGGTGMASLSREETANPADGYTQAWRLLPVSAGTATVAITASGGTPADMAAGSVSLDGAGAYGTPVVANTSNSPTISVSGVAATSMVIAVIGAGIAITTISTGTERYKNNFAGSGGNSVGNVAAGTNTGSGTVTVAWGAMTASMALIAVEVQAGGSAVQGPVGQPKPGPSTRSGPLASRFGPATPFTQPPGVHDIPPAAPVTPTSTPIPVVVNDTTTTWWFNTNTPTQLRSSFQDVPAAIQPAVSAEPPTPPWFNTPTTTVVRNTLQDPPVLTTAPPVVEAAPVDLRWLTTQPAQTFRSSLQDVVVATATPEPVVETVSPAGIWFESNPTQPIRNSLQDFATPGPLVVTSQPAGIWLESNPTQTFRNTLQDPPVLTTADPVVIAQPTPQAFLKTQGPQVLVPPAQPAVAPSVATPAPIVIAAQPDRRWFATEPPQDFRNTTQDPPVLTTADPIVVAAPTPQAFLKPQQPTITRNLQAPIVTPQSASAPVVVTHRGIRVGQGGQAIVIRNFAGGTTAPRVPLHLAGTVTDANLLGGTVTGNRLGGSYTGNVKGGTVTETNHLGGTVTDKNLLSGSVTDANLLSGTVTVLPAMAGSLVEWTMQEVDITLGEFNDEQLAVTVTSSGSALDLTGKTLQALFKTAAGVSDTDPSTITLTSPSGGIVVTNAPGGLATITIPRADLASVGVTFWRLDVVASGLQNTAMYGKVAITPL